jgi:UMF1 family MFS transporter
MTRISFLTVAVWWAVFTIPLWRYVKEPPRRMLAGEEGFNPIQASFSRLAHTFRQVSKFRELLKFIIAFWLYNNGIGTIIYMAGIYGAELQFSDTTIIGTLLMVQFVAIPFALLFGRIAKKLGTKRSIFLSLAIYTCIAIGGYFMQKEIHFWMLGFAVATVQGGSQALSRSLAGRMMPKSQSAEFFSFFSVSEKIAGTMGPLLFSVVSQLMGGSRLSIVSLVIFFIAGGALLRKVNVEEGIRVAENEEASLQLA